MPHGYRQFICRIGGKIQAICHARLHRNQSIGCGFNRRRASVGRQAHKRTAVAALFNAIHRADSTVDLSAPTDGIAQSVGFLEPAVIHKAALCRTDEAAERRQQHRDRQHKCADLFVGIGRCRLAAQAFDPFLHLHTNTLLLRVIVCFPKM